MEKYTKEHIAEKLASDDKWLVRGLLAIFKRQTDAEKCSDQTLENNGIGFNGADSYILSQYAKQYNQKGWLSPKQLALTRIKMRKYAGQLTKIANGRIQ